MDKYGLHSYHFLQIPSTLSQCGDDVYEDGKKMDVSGSEEVTLASATTTGKKMS